MSEFLREHNRVNRETLFQVEILCPVYFLYFVIHLVGRVCLEVCNRFQNSYCRVQLKVSPIHHFLVTGERHHASSCLHIVSSKLCQLLCQNGLQTHERFGDEFKFLFHYKGFSLLFCEWLFYWVNLIFYISFFAVLCLLGYKAQACCNLV